MDPGDLVNYKYARGIYILQQKYQYPSVIMLGTYNYTWRWYLDHFVAIHYP